MKNKRFETLRMGYLAHEHRRLCNAWFSSHGITRGMPFMLHFLLENPGCIQRDLANHWHMDPGSVTSVLNTMENAELIRRETVPEDKRALRVYLTTLGEEKATLVEEGHLVMEKKCLQGFTKEDKERFSHYLDLIEANLEVDTPPFPTKHHHHHPHSKKEKEDMHAKKTF